MSIVRGLPAVWTLVAISAACENRTLVVIDVESVTVDPNAVTLLEGESRSLQAVLRGAMGERLAGRSINWSSDRTSVATVSSTGTLSAIRAGSATIRASAEGETGSTTVSVLVGPSISLSSREASMSVTEGQTAAPVGIVITRGGNGILSGLATSIEYPPSDPAGWLNASLNGTTAPTSLTLTASAISLDAGSYSATVRISSPVGGGVSETVSVTFTVAPAPPRIVLDPEEVAFGAVENGQTPAMQVVQITNGGSGVLTGLAAHVVYEPGQAQGWLTATLSSATAPASMEVEASPGGLQPQTYRARVVVSAPGAENTPLDLIVTFTVAPANGRGGMSTGNENPDRDLERGGGG